MALPFAINLVANLIFTPIQFGMRNLPLAAVDILVVWATIIWCVIAVWRHYRWVAIAQVPYFVWVSLARHEGHAPDPGAVRHRRPTQAAGRRVHATGRRGGFRAEVFTAEGQGHGFFNRSPWLQKTTARMDEFLTSLGYLKREGDVKAEKP